MILGTWKSGQTGQTFAPMTWDITSLLKKPGTYKVEFQYTGGAHRLDIQSIELLAGDTVIAKDEHLGMTGGITKNNTYQLDVKKVDQTVRYTLRAIVRSDCGTDSNGQVYLMKE
jgi:hexosaminidase